MRFLTPIELINTRRKLQELETLYQSRENAPFADEELRDLTLESLSRLMNQLKEEISRTELQMTKIEIAQETDGRWIAEVPELPGVLAYGESREEAMRKAQSLSLRVLVERLEHGEQ